MKGALEEILLEVDKLKEQGYKAICFWLPAYDVGGGTYYLCQLAMYLREHTDLKIYYMDYKDGYPTQVLEGSGVEILEYKDEEIYFQLKEKCAIVTNSTRVIQLKKMNPENKLLFWHYETVPCAWDIVFLLGEANQFFQLCYDEDAIVFHDWSGRDALMKDANCEFKPAYLPIFLPPKEKCSTTSLKNVNEVHLVWLGRLAKEKIYSVENIISNFALYKTDKKKVMHIIGDGHCFAEMKKFANNYTQEIEFIFTGTVPKRRLDQYLKDNADIVFGMGTSVLEGAALHIPSIVVKLDTKPIGGDEFWWLFDSKEYCVGILPEQRKRFRIQYSHFKDIMDDICVYGMKEKHGEACYRHFVQNHSSIEEVIAVFLKHLEGCHLTMQKLENCIKYVPYNHIMVRKRRILGWEFSQKVLFGGGEWKCRKG